MAGDKESIVAFGVTIQPTPNTFNPPAEADLLPIYSPDNGSDPVQAEDDTLTGAIWGAPRQLFGTRGRAGASARLRGPGGSAPPAAGDWVLGRILQAAGFTEIVNATAITGTAQANADTSLIKLAAGASSVDDFYKGFPIQHAGIGSGLRATSMVRGYDGTTKEAALVEVLQSAIANGTYTIPPALIYVLSQGLSIPLLSCSVWRHRKRYDYRDCALNAFAVNIPVSNSQQQELPSVEFSMIGVAHDEDDENALLLPEAYMTVVPPARAGKFVFNGIKIGHQSFRLEFGLETGAPPNQNFDDGQESYEIMSGTRTTNVDLNQQLVASLDLKTLLDNQTPVPIASLWGLGAGNRFLVGAPNTLLDPLNPTTRNGFVGQSGNAAPLDVDRALALSVLW